MPARAAQTAEPGQAAPPERRTGLRRRLAFEWNAGWAAAFLGILALVFYWKVLFTSKVSFPWDALDFFYPYLAYVHEELRHLRLPLWDPYVFSGFPIIGDPEAQIFYPPNWLLVLLNPFSHLSFRWVEIQAVVHFVLAGLFMFYLARDFTRNAYASLLGGILFMFSGAMVAHTEHVATINANAWYPLVFLLARRGLLDNRIYWTLAAGLFFGIENLAGHWQHAVYLGLLLFLYFAYESFFGPRRRELWPRWIYQLGLIAGVSAGLSLVQILPSMELSGLSIRSFVTYWDVTQGNSPQFLWTLFLPDYLGGVNGVPLAEGVEPSMNYVFLTVPGCLLALVGLVEMARRRNFFWLGLILICIDLSIGRTGLLADLAYHVPLLNFFRQTPVYFDLANLALCLMASVGAHALAGTESIGPYRKWLSVALLALLPAAAAVGLIVPSVSRTHGWVPMLAALGLSCLFMTAAMWNKQGVNWVRWVILGLVIAQLMHYSMNQPFNASAVSPVTSLSHDWVSDRKESIGFLRSDPNPDFRVAAFAEPQWNNGPSVFRIPGIYGWNPIQLLDYQEYVRQFTRVNFFTLPFGASDHNLNSPMLDLLGVKYVVALDQETEQMGLRGSDRFEKAFSDLDWWSIYRRKEHFPRAWFYPRAYVLPEKAPVLGLMNSAWFSPRGTLLLSGADATSADWPPLERLLTVPITTDRIQAFSTGQVNLDDHCARQRSKFMYWMGNGHWVRFDLGEPVEPGRYMLLMEYASAGDRQPLLTAEIAQGERKNVSGPVRLPRSSGWDCNCTRIAELGQFELASGAHQVTLTLVEDTGIDLYSLWLIRLPAAPPPDAADYSFGNFSISANDFAFDARLGREGFVLVNEIDYPGWTAAIDGIPAPIIRADGVFRALRVTPGTHRIEMRFHSRYLLPGAVVSILTLLVLAAGLIRLRQRKDGVRS